LSLIVLDKRRLRLNPDLKKEDLKVRLLKDGILEIEWPRRVEEGEEIEVE
jgi:HSP20 family molecular chaperone IbpA